MYRDYGIRKTYEENEVDFIQPNEKIMSKSLWASKTMWFNFIVGVVAILALPEFVAILPAVYLKYAVFVGAAGNLILRLYFTKTSLE